MLSVMPLDRPPPPAVATATAGSAAGSAPPNGIEYDTLADSVVLYGSLTLLRGTRTDGR